MVSSKADSYQENNDEVMLAVVVQSNRINHTGKMCPFFCVILFGDSRHSYSLSCLLLMSIMYVHFIGYIISIINLVRLYFMCMRLDIFSPLDKETNSKI